MDSLSLPNPEGNTMPAHHFHSPNAAVRMLVEVCMHQYADKEFLTVTCIGTYIGASMCARLHSPAQAHALAQIYTCPITELAPSALFKGRDGG